MLLATARAGADGALRADVTVPASTPAGAHTVVVTDAAGTTVRVPITVTAAAGLAATGTELVPWIAVAAVVLAAAGVAGILIARRRRG